MEQVRGRSRYVGFFVSKLALNIHEVCLVYLLHRSES